MSIFKTEPEEAPIEPQERVIIVKVNSIDDLKKPMTDLDEHTIVIVNNSGLSADKRSEAYALIMGVAIRARAAINKIAPEIYVVSIKEAIKVDNTEEKLQTPMNLGEDKIDDQAHQLSHHTLSDKD